MVLTVACLVLSVACLVLTVSCTMLAVCVRGAGCVVRVAVCGAPGADFKWGVGIAGHSMGGQSTVFASSLGNASGSNITAAVMHHAYTHAYPAPQVPFLAFTGEQSSCVSRVCGGAF